MLRTTTTTTLARAATISAARITTPLVRRAFTTCSPEYTLSYATPLATGSGASPLRVPKLDQSADMLSKVQRSSHSTTHGVRPSSAPRPKVVGLEDTALYLGVLEQRCAINDAVKN